VFDEYFRLLAFSIRGSDAMLEATGGDFSYGNFFYFVAGQPFAPRSAIYTDEWYNFVADFEENNPACFEPDEGRIANILQLPICRGEQAPG
jgi:hypothetical protein